MKTPILTALVLASFTALAAGCAAPTDGDSEEVGASEDAIHGKTSLLGSYFTETPKPGGYLRLALESDGTYTAEHDISLVAMCITYPCSVPEKGTWTYSWGRISLLPDGAKEPARYWARRSGDKLTLRDSQGTQELYVLPDGQCVSNLDCDDGSVCPVAVCLMYCQVNDPNCCGPRKCVPKNPPPPPPPGACTTDKDCASDESCEEPICPLFCDATDPDCCGPKTCQKKPPPPLETCGSTTCGPNEVCCNPLAGICTKPGEFCAF